MPYKLVGKTIYSKASGQWKPKQKAKTLDRAKAAMRLLYSLEGKKK